MKALKKLLKVLGTLLIIAIFLVIMVGSSVALGFAYVRLVGNEAKDEDINFEDIFKKEVVKEDITVLVLGTNQNLSDFIMVAKYIPETGKVSLLSIPRDTKYTGKNGPNTAWSKINAIYQGQYIDKLKNTVEDMLDIEIDYYLVFDKKALWEVVDAIGGVTVDIGTKALKYSDPAQGLYIDLKPGVQKLNGKQAEQYVRYRKGYANGDLGRIEAQQNFIKAFIKECIKPSNILKLPNAATVALDDVKTDITLDVILYYLEDVAKFDMENIEIETLPGYADMLGGVSFYIYYENDSKKLADRLFNGIVEEESDTTSSTIEE